MTNETEEYKNELYRGKMIEQNKNRNETVVGDAFSIHLTSFSFFFHITDIDCIRFEL